MLRDEPGMPGFRRKAFFALKEPLANHVRGIASLGAARLGTQSETFTRTVSRRLRDGRTRCVAGKPVKLPRRGSARSYCRLCHDGAQAKARLLTQERAPRLASRSQIMLLEEKVQILTSIAIAAVVVMAAQRWL